MKEETEEPKPKSNQNHVHTCYDRLGNLLLAVCEKEVLESVSQEIECQSVSQLEQAVFSSETKLLTTE